MAVPKDGRPVKAWPDIDEAFLDVVRHIKAIIGDLAPGLSTEPSKVSAAQGPHRISNRPRSGNLSIKKEFTEEDKDNFLEDTFAYMALAITAVLSPNLMNAMIAISVLWWTWHTRLIYSITRTLKTQEFVEAAEILGASKFHILFRELLPNCVSAISVKATLDAGFVILIGASLSFLGLGVQPPTPDLGTMHTPFTRVT